MLISFLTVSNRSIKSQTTAAMVITRACAIAIIIAYYAVYESAREQLHKNGGGMSREQ